MYKSEEYESRFYRHWQNLYKEDHPEALFSGLRHGRAWLNDHKSHIELDAEWQIPTTFWQIKVTIENHEIHFALGCGLFAIWLSAGGIKWIRRSDYHKREIGLSISNGVINWKIWTDPNEWHTKTPKWRDGWFNVVDCLLGRQKYSNINQGSKHIIIQMPEANYPAILTFSTSTWKRPRWHWIKQAKYAEIEVEKGVPVPGKGESEWDIDEDAIFSSTFRCTSERVAIAHFIDSIEEARRKYGGKNWKPKTTNNRKTSTGIDSSICTTRDD